MTDDEITGGLLMQNVAMFLGDQPMIRVSDETELPLFNVIAKRGMATGVWAIHIGRAGRPIWDAELALRSLHRSGFPPQFLAYPEIIYTISDENPADYTVEQWLKRTDFGLEVRTLKLRTEIIERENQTIALRAAARPENRRAVAQMRRQADIETALPTADVDAWIVANMGYTAESLAALGKATRRDRRREARRQMMLQH